MHVNSRLIFEKYAKDFFSDGNEVLELGPDATPSTFQKIVGPKAALWETLEVSNWLTTTTYTTPSPYEFPLPDDRYDIVFSAQVIEHVPHIWRWMKEVARVCKPGGLVITINPLTWFYHEAPVDCWRIYPEGMKALSEDSGLDVILSEWESVELERMTRRLPPFIRDKKVRLQRLSGIADLVGRSVGGTFRGAFDTITVARKRAS